MSSELRERKTQAAQIQEIYRERAVESLDSAMKILRIGKYDVDGRGCTRDLRTEIMAWQKLAEAYTFLGDTEDALEAWEKLLDAVSRRKSELLELKGETAVEEVAAANKRKEINHAMHMAYCYLGRYRFDCFLIAMEFMLPDGEKRWYCNRRNIIRQDALELEKLEYGQYRFMGLSAPPRTYKTALGTRFLAWVIGRHPDESSFFVSHTARMCRKVMNDIVSLLSNPVYKLIFPQTTFKTSSEDMWIDVYPKETENGYRTLYFAGIDSAMAGVINCSWLLYCDDLIAGTEEAINPDRVERACEKYVGDIRQRRANGNVRELMIATRWATKDPLAEMERLHSEDPAALFIKRPALNENGESNFMFKHNPLTKEHFLEIKSSMDLKLGAAMFECIYQQNPMDREGLLFTDLKRYRSLPPGKPDFVFAACDVAFSGADNLACPVAYQYGDEVYIPDVVFNPNGWEITEPLVVAFITKHCPNFAKFESNNGGDFYAKDVKNALVGVCDTRIVAERTPSSMSKVRRIEQHEPTISSFYFLHPSLYAPTSAYAKFMAEVESFNVNGRNKHDDAPDSLAMLAAMKIKGDRGASVCSFKRKGRGRRR